MLEKRSNKDRRVNGDRRIRSLSSYKGPENRVVNQQRRNNVRRVTGNDSFVKRTLSLGKEGRRFGVDQRQFSYAEHIPERRLCHDRRGLLDRRKH
jgi:hypothetical protein